MIGREGVCVGGSDGVVVSEMLVMFYLYPRVFILKFSNLPKSSRTPINHSLRLTAC